MMNRCMSSLAVLVCMLCCSSGVYAQSIVATVTVGSFTIGEAVDATHGLLHVVNQSSNSLSTINLSTRAVVHTTNVGSYPGAVAVTPSGLVYVANSNTVTVINPSNNYSTTTIGGVANPYAMAYNPVNGKIYVVAFQQYPNNKILIINPAANNSETFVYEATGGGWAIAVDPHSGVVYVGSNVPSGCYTCADKITIIDPNTNNTTYVTVGRENITLAVDSNSGKVYVPNYLDNTLSIINPAAGNSVSTVSVGNNPFGVALDASGMVYVSNFSDNTVSVLNPSSGYSSQTIHIGQTPGAMAYDSGTNTIIVGNGQLPSSGTASVISASTLTATNFTGLQSYVVAVDALRGESYLTGGGSNVYILRD